VIFLISNDQRRSLAATGVLHVAGNCPSLGGENRRGWEATLSEIASAYTLCGQCAPRMTAGELPAPRP
jgi:hypothetical protein